MAKKLAVGGGAHLVVKVTGPTAGVNQDAETAPVTVAALAANEKNPRRISDLQLEGLRKSLAEFGPLDGFVFNRRSGKLVGGHQRQKSLPDNSPVVITEKFDSSPQGTVARGYIEMPNGERITYREVDWPDAKEKAAMVAANKHSGEWETEMLGQILNELEQSDRELTGFDQLEIERMLQTIPAETGLNDPAAEWVGMPECEHEDQQAVCRVMVNFKTLEDKKAFGVLIGQPLAGLTLSKIWYPEVEWDRVADLETVEAEPQS